MAFTSRSTLQQTKETAATASSSVATGGGGGGTAPLRNEVLSFPENEAPERITVFDTAAPESEVQSAVDRAANNGGGLVIVGSQIPPYDASSVTFDNSVRMEVSGNKGGVFDVQAYGAAGDNSTDDYEAVQGAVDGFNAQQKISAPLYFPEGTYRLGQQVRILPERSDIIGDGWATSTIRAHPDLDTTAVNAVVIIGGKNTAQRSGSSVRIQNLGFEGRADDVSACKIDFDFSLWIDNCLFRSGAYTGTIRVGGLHIYRGKNIFVSDCQIATSSGAGVLVDDRGTGGGLKNYMSIENTQITENGTGGVVLRQGTGKVKIVDCLFGSNGAESNGAEGGHDIFANEFARLHVSDSWFGGSTYGVAAIYSFEVRVYIKNNRFSGLSRQSIAVQKDRMICNIVGNDFINCGSDHTAGSIDKDYTTSDQVADIHLGDVGSGIYHVARNNHFDENNPDRLFGIVHAEGTRSNIGTSDNDYLLVADNTCPPGGYRDIDGAVIEPGNSSVNLPKQAHGPIKGKTGREAAGAGNTPTAADWRPGDLVQNSDDEKLYLLLRDGSTWYDFAQDAVAVDLGDDGATDIDPLRQISTTSDTQGVFAQGDEDGELAIDIAPIALRADDETIPGQWQYEQEIDWTSQIDGVGYEGYVQIPVDAAAQTEYILISELDGNGTNQRLTATLFVGRTTASSVSDHGATQVYYNQSDDGSYRNFSVRSVVDTEKANEGFDARPVAVDYNSTRWAAVEVSVGFGKIQWRTLAPHHTGNYDLSALAAKSSSNVSNVTPWEDGSEGSLAREEVRAKSLMHDESRSFDFQSGWASGDGWIAAEMGPQGKPHYFEASHMVLRGTLRVRELILEQLRVRKGIQIISPGGGKLERVESEAYDSIDAGEFHNWVITGVDTSADTVTLDDSTGDLDPTATLGAGQRVAISDSTADNGNYTVASLTDNGDGTTTVEVNENISDSTADGRLYEATVQRWYFENPDDTASAHGMSAGDRALAQRFDPEQQQVVAQVRGVVELVYSTHQILVTVSTNYTAPSTGQETEGYEFAVVGSANSNRQSILVDSPFQPGREVLDGLSGFDDWDNRADFLRKLSGNLDGRYDYSQEAYGLAAGPTEGEYITADSVKGVRIVDNTSGNQTVRAQLSGTRLTLGSTADEHIKIDPNQSGLQFINASGTEVGRFDGTLLRLGSDGQIRFDPTQSPEATIEGTLEMGASGVITNATNDFRTDDKGYAVATTSTFEEDNALAIKSPDYSTVYGAFWGTKGRTTLEARNNSLRINTTNNIYVNLDEDNSGSGFLRIKGGDETLKLGGQDSFVIAGDAATWGPGIQMDWRSSKLSQSQVPAGTAIIYLYRIDSDNYNLRVGWHKESGNYKEQALAT